MGEGHNSCSSRWTPAQEQNIFSHYAEYLSQHPSNGERDPAADELRNEIVVRYASLARYIAKKEMNRLPASADKVAVMGDAMVGLIKAVETYNLEKEVAFSTYAAIRIKWEIYEELRNQDVLPRTLRTAVKKAKRTSEDIRQKLQHEPSMDEIIAQMMADGYNEDKCNFIRGNGAYAKKIYHGTKREKTPKSSHVGIGGRNYLLSEFSEEGLNIENLVRDNFPPPWQNMMMGETMWKIYNLLGEKEVQILVSRYWDDMPLREIGEKLGISESRVCTIHDRAINRLREKSAVMKDLECVIETNAA